MRRFGIQLIYTPIVFALTVAAATADLHSCEPGAFWLRRCVPLQVSLLNRMLVPSSALGQGDGAVMPRIDGPCCVYYPERFIATTGHVPAARRTRIDYDLEHRNLEI